MAFQPRTVLLKDGRTATVRPGTSADSENIVALRDAVGAEGVFVMSERSIRTPEELRKEVETNDPTTVAWVVAEVEGRVIGEALVFRGRWKKNAHTASLGMAVRKEHRGLGIGEALLRAGIEWARSVGVRKFRLEVFATNGRAIHLYHKLGFVVEGRLKDEVILEGKPVDEVQMALWLS